MLDAALVQQSGERFALLDRNRTDQNRTTGQLNPFDFCHRKSVFFIVIAILNHDLAVVLRNNFSSDELAIVQEHHFVTVIVLDLVGDGFPLVFFVAKDQVGILASLQRAVGRNRHHVQAVDLVEFFGLGHRGTRHAADLVVQFEVIL